MRKAVMPKPAPRLDDEATYQAYRRFGDMTRDSYEGVNDLRARTDLLEGVVGYGNASMSRNEWVTSAGVYLPFNAQVGPMKGVSIVGPYGPNGYGFELHSRGLWRVDAHSTPYDTLFTGDDWCDLDIEVYRPDGSLFEAKRYMIGAAGSARRSVGGPHTFVVPEPGYRVFVLGRSGRWRPYMGGTFFSTLSINKWDNGVTAQAPGTVPTGPQPT